jgi:hypothetical protein
LLHVIKQEDLAVIRELTGRLPASLGPAALTILSHFDHGSIPAAAPAGDRPYPMPPMGSGT